MLEKTLHSLNNIGLTIQPQEIVLITDEPKIPNYFCFLKKDTQISLKVIDIFGQGSDLDNTKAKIKATAECLERLCLEKPFEDNIFVGEYRFGEEFIDPALFCCYSEEQINKLTFIEDVRKEKYIWWPIKDLLGKTFLIPAQLVFISKDFDNEFPIRKERISTGSALGSIDNQYAFQAGLLETMERDAFISAYITKKNIARIVNLPDELSKLINYLKRYQLEPYVFDIRNDLNVPTVLVITLDKTEIGSAINVGARADMEYFNAIKCALLESIQCRRTFRIEKKPKQIEPVKINSIDERLLYWSSTERIKDLDFWFKSPRTVNYEDLLEYNTTTEKVLETLTLKKYNIFVADITIPQIRANGFEVVKVIIPELHPLYINEDAKALYSIHHGAIRDNKTLKPHPFI